MYCAGAIVVGMHTVAPLTEGCGLNIAVIFHGDVMDVSVCACPDNVPAVNDIATGIAHCVGFWWRPHKNLHAGKAAQSSRR